MKPAARNGAPARSVRGERLQPCCTDPVTGYYRDGFCHTGPEDRGSHVVCAVMTEEFLTFTKEQGNDLSTPQPRFNFRGLKPGDSWCLCALRWKEAYDAGMAPPVNLEATHEKALTHLPLAALEKHAIDG